MKIKLRDGPAILARVKKSSMLYCDLCGYRTKFPSYLKRHKLVHGCERQFACGLCGSKFKTSSAYYLHLREVHTSDKYVCQDCGASFTHKRVLDRHMLCHQQEKPIACTCCGYHCKRKQDLDQHMRNMHAGKPRQKRHEEIVAGIFCALQLKFTREFTVKVPTFAERKFARVDFHIEKPWGWLLWEVDETSHCGYRVSDECRRMDSIWGYFREHHPGMRLHVVRYNSHAYKQDGVIIRPTHEERAAAIEECLAHVPKSPFVITYLYYRSIGQRVAVTLDSGYTLQDHVRVPQNAIST